jgi:hypothetical protein
MSEEVDNPYIGRLVTAASPFIGTVAVAIANWAQDALNVNLDGTQLAVFLTGVFVSVLYVVKTWLDNRGAYERLVEAGETITTRGKQYSDSGPGA